MFCDPRAELALAIHRKTDNDKDIEDFLKDVLGRNIPDIRLDHQLQAARMLTKHGHFPDADLFIQRHAGKRSPRKSRREQKKLSQFDPALPKTGIHSPAPQDDGRTEPATEDPESDYVAMAKEIVACLDPSEFEEEPASTHRPDYSMWDIIDSLPQPEITEEHARIGAALFREAIQRQRLWKESDVKIPTRKDHDN